MSKPYAGRRTRTVRWRMPEAGSFGFNQARLHEIGVGENGCLLRRFLFLETVTITEDQHIEVDDNGAMWLANAEGRIRELKGTWERIHEQIRE